MFYYLSPAGNRLPIKAICRALTMMKRVDTVKIFELRLKDLLKVKHCFLTSSGTAALYLALISLRELSNKHEVIMPAYTCPSVFAAVIKSGLKPVLCDLDEEKSNFNYNELKNKISNHTLAIISVHLFGIPEDYHRINNLISPFKVFHIEDAAQSFGSTINYGNDTIRSQDMLGTCGDIGIYSFGRGKPLTLMQGGALTTNSDIIAKVLSQKANDLDHQSAMVTFIAILNVLLYSIFMHPRFYWFPQHLPFLKLGETILNLNFKKKLIDAFTSALGIVMIEHIARITKVRVKKENLLYQKLSSFSDCFLTNGSKKSVLLRFPMLMKNKHKKELLLYELKRRGIGATGMYPAPLNQFKDSRKYFKGNSQYENAQSFSERIITLPLHEFVTEKDINKIRNIMEKIIGNDDRKPIKATD